MLADQRQSAELGVTKPNWMGNVRARLLVLASLAGVMGLGCASPQGGFSMSSDSPTPYFSFGFTPEWPWKTKSQDRSYRSVRLEDARVVAGAKQVSTRVKARWPDEFWPEQQSWMSPGSSADSTEPVTGDPVSASKRSGKRGKNLKRMPLPRTDQAGGVEKSDGSGGEVPQELSPENRSVSSEIPRTGRF
jgi:hypothetical protein